MLHWQNKWYMQCGWYANMLIQHPFTNLGAGWKWKEEFFITPWASFVASITSQGLLDEAKQQQTPNKIFASLHWRNVLRTQDESKKSVLKRFPANDSPRKTNPKKLLTPAHTRHQFNIGRYLGRNPARRTAPPQRIKKNANAHPYTGSKSPNS